MDAVLSFRALELGIDLEKTETLAIALGPVCTNLEEPEDWGYCSSAKIDVLNSVKNTT